MTEEDEWEKAADNLSKLNFTEPTSSDNNSSSSSNGPTLTSSTGVAPPPLPQTYSSDLNNKAPPLPWSGHNNNNDYRCSSIIEDEGGIDSALLSAMSNNRERMVLFQIEEDILKFVRSNDSAKEIPPVHNSFRRLIAYRVGQRFGLQHATSDIINESGERGITLYKVSTSGIPRTLLIDMNISQDTAAAAVSNANINRDESDYYNQNAQVIVPLKDLQSLDQSVGIQNNNAPK